MLDNGPHLSTGTFVTRDILSLGTFCPWYILCVGRFVREKFCLGTFCLRTFCLRTFYIKMLIMCIINSTLMYNVQYNKDVWMFCPYPAPSPPSPSRTWICCWPQDDDVSGTINKTSFFSLSSQIRSCLHYILPYHSVFLYRRSIVT